jgi:hypothetical protein
MISRGAFLKTSPYIKKEKEKKQKKKKNMQICEPWRLFMCADIQKHAGGRPLKLQNEKKVQKIIDEYFTKCETEKQPVTLMGLCIALDINKDTFGEYMKGEGEHAKISDLIKRAHRRVEHAYEERGLKSNNPAFCIFVLKNMGWFDKTDIDINAKLRPSSYSEDDEAALREFARLRALAESTKATTAGNEE